LESGFPSSLKKSPGKDLNLIGFNMLKLHLEVIGDGDESKRSTVAPGQDRQSAGGLFWGSGPVSSKAASAGQKHAKQANPGARE
jgi:hypothetical protein